MSEFVIKDEDLTAVKGKVVVLTGGSSGIGLATVKLLLSLGALVVSGDLNAPAESGPLFVKTNVTKWSDLAALFKKAKETHGRIDYVFANAGIGPRANYLELATDANGDLVEPSHEVLDVNLNSVVNTAVLALHYLKQQPEGGSIVLMGSSTGLQPLRAADYSIAKHGVLGLGRGISKLVSIAKLPIRVNTLMPSWTSSQILPDLDGIMSAIKYHTQPAIVIAKAATYLLVNQYSHGDVVFVSDGKYTEIEKAILAPAYATVKGDSPTDDEILERILALGS